MNYIYHIKPEPFVGTCLIPLNSMDKNSSLYKSHADKYIGRESLMLELIPKLNCRWNDVVQFSSLDPQIIYNKLKEIQTDLSVKPFSYFKIPIDNILQNHEAAIFRRKSNKVKGDFSLSDDEVELIHLDNYKELTEVPEATIVYWENIKQTGGNPLWFPYVPHIFVKGIIETKQFEICNLVIKK